MSEDEFKRRYLERLTSRFLDENFDALAAEGAARECYEKCSYMDMDEADQADPEGAADAAFDEYMESDEKDEDDSYDDYDDEDDGSFPFCAP